MPVVNGKYLNKVLESIFNSTFENFEVIINDSSERDDVRDILSVYDTKVIRKKTNNFEGRILTIMNSHGEKVFLLDETRIIPMELLSKISQTDADMIVIKERDVGKGLFIFLSNLEKTSMPDSIDVMDPMRNKSIIPRVYKKDVVSRALSAIAENIDPEVQKRIIGMDLELIYLESYNITKDIKIISSPEIIHQGDETLSSIFEKYYRYGYSQNLLRETFYKDFAGLSGRNRVTLPIRDRLMSIPIQVLRGVPFVAGYLNGSKRRITEKIKLML